MRIRVAMRRALLGASILSGAFNAAYAQDQQPNTNEGETQTLDQIVVTGFRASLESAARLKRESTGFIDAITAEDIGKFPDTNIAESFNRIPGITISRETNGDGVNIAIRGLGTNFTRILLNDAPIAVASAGRFGSQNTNREVDLDLFPSELFSQLTVYKSSKASLLEGGAAGTVNLRSARPFDKEGTRVNYSFQGTKGSQADKWGYRGSVIASTTLGDFGILAGFSAVRAQNHVEGFESVGWTNPNLSTPAQCASNCNTTGGGNWTIPATVPSNAGNGLTPGAPINQALLLANNPGLSLQQLDNAIIPRLGRPYDESGSRDRKSAILSLEYKPSDTFHAYVDSIYGTRTNDLVRQDLNWVGRNGAAIPLNVQVDRSDCAQGCVVTQGTYANSQFFLEYRPFLEKVDFWGVNPGLEWTITDNFKADLTGNWTESTYLRSSPTVLVITPANSGVTVDYVNNGGIPQITPNIDLNDPANFGWPGGRVNIQDERRKTQTKGVRGNFTYGGDELNVHFGGSYDDVSRRIRAFDNSQAWQNAVCGNNPNVFLPSPNSQPPCQGLNAPGAAPAGYPTYPGLGTGFSAGRGPLTYQGSLIPNSALSTYLRPNSTGFITVDWDRFRQDSNYDAFRNSAPEAGSSNTGASGGFVREKVIGTYVELNGDTTLLENRLRYNVGLRYTRTNQTIGGNVSIQDNRNTPPAPAPALADGARYPNITNFIETENTYDNWLPSGTLTYNVSDNALVRFALSRTLTRPDPNAQLPGLNFSSPSADVGSVGNPALDPFRSDNIDVGFEYYTGGAGYISVAAFRKKVQGFTTPGTVTLPFSALAQFGVTFNTLTPTQQDAINARGGPGAATVVLQQQVNASGSLSVNGLEFAVSQPLDFVLEQFGLKGFGVTGNLTLVDQKGSGAAPAIALGVASYTYNATVYYENYGVSARLSVTHTEGSQASGANQNGIPLAAIFSDDYRQWDFSSSIDLATILDNDYLPQLTFDITNIFNRAQRSYFQFNNAAFNSFQPGRQISIGFRGRF